ncbi:MAG: winged helix-turn-helix domain-containing protein [Candidatus Aminicenantaceae bacterium]
MLNQKAVIVNQALGWLAREGKINYRREGNRTLISLVDTERRS